MKIRSIWPFGGTEDLDAERHHQLCLMVPFPRDLDLSGPEPDLTRLRQYAEALAISAVDWYIRKRRWKKIWSRVVRYTAYTLALIGALIPLLNVLAEEVQDALLDRLTGGTITNGSDLTAEFSLVFIGIAGGIVLIDRFLGLSSGWMRYVKTAMDISQNLSLFHLRWTELEHQATRAKLNQHQPVLAPPPPEENGTCCRCKKPCDGKEHDDAQDVTAAKIELARDFCASVFIAVAGETNEWRSELQEGEKFIQAPVQSAFSDPRSSS